MSTHWAHGYIGRRWVSGARGPDTFDCWGLLWYVKRKHYGQDVPEYPGIDAASLGIVTGLIDSGAKQGDWEQLLFPIDGCAVGMSRGRRLHHVGIYVDVDGGLVLHAHDRARVLAQSIPSLRNAGYRRIEFFEHKPHGTRRPVH
jgi:cell wall-associated NlpC family hydrolase